MRWQVLRPGKQRRTGSGIGLLSQALLELSRIQITKGYGQFRVLVGVIRIR